ERERHVFLHQADVEPGFVRQVEDELGARLQHRRAVGLCVITSTASLGSMPARSASSSPSAKASICTARLMLIASFSTSPCPFWPTCVGSPSSRRNGSTRAYACSSPPTMIVSVPACTWGTLPDTGASSNDAPHARTRSASSRL